MSIRPYLRSHCITLSVCNIWSRPAVHFSGNGLKRKASTSRSSAAAAAGGNRRSARSEKGRPSAVKLKTTSRNEKGGRKRRRFRPPFLPPGIRRPSLQRSRHVDGRHEPVPDHDLDVLVLRIAVMPVDLIVGDVYRYPLISVLR